MTALARVSVAVVGLSLAIVTILFLVSALAWPGRKNASDAYFAHFPTGSSSCTALGGGMLEEAPSPEESADPCWWVDSGAALETQRSARRTLHGALSEESRWRSYYAASNPTDTDGGLHPQNIFRLISRKSWRDSSQTLMFRVHDYHLSASPERNESNGVLLFAHYRGEDDLYYAGVRVDGQVVIKKKTGGVYHTLALTPYFSGTYDPKTAPLLIPVERRIGLRLDTRDLTDGSVLLTLFVDDSGDGNWTQALSVRDDGATSQGALPLRGAGSVGIRTDFMDVAFEDYRVGNLQLLKGQ